MRDAKVQARPEQVASFLLLAHCEKMTNGEISLGGGSEVRIILAASAKCGLLKLKPH